MVKRLTLLLSSLLLSVQICAAPPLYLAEVDGLACPFCVYGIEKKLGQLDGVDKIESDLKAGKLRIHMKGNKTLTEAQVREAVKSSGFSLRSFSRIEAESQQ